MTTIDTTPETIFYPVRAIIEYQMMGDHAGDVWLPMVMDPAKAQGKIDDYALVYSAPIGGWGIQLVIFTIDFKAPDGPFPMAEDLADMLANALVGDSDCTCRGVTSLVKP